MRFFIALEIPNKNKKQLFAIQNQIKQIIPQVRLTNNTKLHLTIAFVGEQPEELKDQLTEVIKAATVNISPFKITPAYIDGFPNLHRANIIWVGIKGDIDKLFVLRERVKDGLVSLGLESDERRYIPHIAIAKLQNFQIKNFQEHRLEDLSSITFEPIPVNSIKLFESIPNHGFHSHNTLAEVKLTN